MVVYDKWNFNWFRNNIHSIVKDTPEENILFHQPQEYDLYNNCLNSYRELNELLVKHNKFLTLHTGAESPDKFNERFSNVRIVEWESFYYFVVDEELSDNVLEHHKTPSKLFVILVTIKPGRDNRLYILNEIYRNKLNHFCDLGITNHIKHMSWVPNICDYPLKFMDSDTIELSHFKIQDIMLPSEVTNRNQRNIPVEFIDSSFNIVIETIYDNFFPTEKTIRPLFIKKPFMVFSSQHYHKKLNEKYGIKLFDNIIDYSFDEIENTRDRYDLQIQELVKIKNTYTPSDIFKLTKDTTQYNYEIVMEIRRNFSESISEEYASFLRNHIKYG
jgi:hypothetical protein